MHINLMHVGTNQWFDYKSDIITGLYCALSELGHEVLVSHNRADPLHFNVVIGSDWVQSEEVVSQFQKLRGGYAIFEIEHLRGQTVNNRPNYNWNLYLELVHAASFVFSPYALNRIAFEEDGLASKFTSFKWGFYPELVDNRYRHACKKKYLCSFVGMAKGRRRALLESFLTRYGEQFQFITASDPYTLKDFKLMQSRWSLSLKNEGSGQFESINPFRIFHHLANGLPVLANHNEDPDGYSDYVVYSPSESIVEFVGESQAVTRAQCLELARASSLVKNLSPVFG